MKVTGCCINEVGIAAIAFMDIFFWYCGVYSGFVGYRWETPSIRCDCAARRGTSGESVGQEVIALKSPTRLREGGDKQVLC